MTISNFELVDLANKKKVTLNLNDIIMHDQIGDLRIRKFMNVIINFACSGMEGTHCPSPI